MQNKIAMEKMLQDEELTFTFISFEKWRTVAFIVSIRHSTVSAM